MYFLGRKETYGGLREERARKFFKPAVQFVVPTGFFCEIPNMKFRKAHSSEQYIQGMLTAGMFR